jgi:acetylcholinesterase
LHQVNGLLGALEQIVFAPIGNQGEDCLSINVQVPSGFNSTAGLPVMLFIHGGGFELGSSAALGSETTLLPGLLYQGANIVQRSIEMDQPIVYVSANHRLNAFGAINSKELNDTGASNILLKDQRTAMEWVQKYIGKFGGDKDRVTLYGESAGSLAIATHMLLNDGKPDGLFRGAIMASGGISKVKDIHTDQYIFDFIVEQSGCGSAADKLACLKVAPYEKVYNAVQQLPNFFSYTSVRLPGWLPRPDGTFLVDSPHRLLRDGKVADIPYIIGDMKDEGTLFSVIAQLNITTDADFQKFWKDVWFHDATDEEIREFTDSYSTDPREGSPFDTGVLNQLGPQYKRLAAAIGDYVFHAGRRDLLEQTYAQGKRRSWTFQIEQSLPVLGQIDLLGGLTNLPVLGSFHASDVAFNSFGFISPLLSQNSRNIMSTNIAFVNSLDPNNHGLKDVPHWPNWTPDAKAMFNFKETGPNIIKDDFREAAMRLVNDNAETYII